jgi:serine protease inhibitor
VSMALGTLLNGARGATRDSMLSVLQIDGYSVRSANEQYRHLIDLLPALDPEVVFEIANSIWGDLRVVFKEAFVESCETYFDAEVRTIDFIHPDAVDTINAWVSDKTHGRIPGILPEDIPPILVMGINAIYFLATWSKEFDPEYTSDELFTLPDGSSTLCRMMKRPGPEPAPYTNIVCDYEYYSNDDVQIVDLAYGDSLFSMTLFLPRETVHVDTLISWLDADMWLTYIESLQDCFGRVQMPRFEVEYSNGLEDILSAMGMGIVFSTAADLTGILDGDYWVGAVRHATYLRVDEAGTEAAAVTEWDIPTGNTPDCYCFKMTLNRPFVFAIREKQTGTILFLGKIADPVYF